MKINPYIQVQQLYNNQKTVAGKKAGTVSRKDGLVISNIGKEIQAAKQAVAAAPDIRTDITEPIRAAMNDGTYKVNSEKFADKLLRAAEQI